MKNVYDNSTFFKEYQETRAKEVNANNLIENPIMKEMLPKLNGKTILDLGCGAGDMDKYFVQEGAKRVLATDISVNMINVANEVNGDNKIEYQVLKMEDLNNITEKFDIVYSSLAFHYIEDFNKLTSDIYNLLNENGMLLYSQEHPNALAPVLELGMKNRVEINGTTYYLLNNYSVNGKREFLWNNCAVVKYHRNFECIINTLIENKFNIVQIKESYASEKAIQLVPKYIHQKDRPFFLFIKVQKGN